MSKTLMSVRETFSKLIVLSLACCMVSCVVSCAAFTTHVKPISEMTPLEKATLAMSTYNNMADNYRIRVTLPNLSDAEKNVLHTEYKLMTRMWPAIDLYYRAAKDPSVSVTEAVIIQVSEFLKTYRY